MDAEKKTQQQPTGLPYALLFAGGYALALASLAPFMLVLAIALYGAGWYLRKNAIPLGPGALNIEPQLEKAQKIIRTVGERLTPPARPEPPVPPASPVPPVQSQPYAQPEPFVRREPLVQREASARPGLLVWQDCPTGDGRICIDGLCAGFTRNDIQQLYEELGRKGKTSAGYALGLRHHKAEFTEIPKDTCVDDVSLLTLLKHSIQCDVIRCGQFNLRTSKGVARVHGVLIRPRLSSHMHLAVIFLQKGGRGVLHVFTMLMPTAQMEKSEAIGIATNASAELNRAEAEIIAQAEHAVRRLLRRA